MVHRCGQKPSGEEVSASLLYSRTMDRLNKRTKNNKKKLAKHYISLPLYIPALHHDFNY
jgi:hypothetical protein